jgi:cellulose biosynthesis protein BcsQ
MIHIIDVAQRINSFLEDKGFEKYKIFIRINFSLDVYVFTSKPVASQELRELFFESLTDSLKGKRGKSLEDSLEDGTLYYYSNRNNMRINFSVFPLSAIDDPFYQNILTGDSDSTIEYGPRYRFESLIGTKKENAVKQDIPVITFYSYKGGMGRTTALVSYAMDLAINKKKRVVIVDCDLEAPGYLNFFDLSEHYGLKSGKKNGVVEFISDAQFVTNRDNLDINDYVINVGNDNANKVAYNNLSNIWLVPAGNLNESYENEGYDSAKSSENRRNYLEGLSRINLANISTVVEDFQLLFVKLKETIHPDIILLDSRTGFNDIFGTTAFILSSYVVGFFGFSRQTQPGLMNLLNEYYNPASQFKLSLVFSILPPNTDQAEDLWAEAHKQEIINMISRIETEKKDLPFFHYLHRNPALERIGTGDNASDEAFVNLIKDNKFGDYSSIFEKISSLYFKEAEEPEFSADTPSLTLRNVVLKQLKDALENVANFAEDTDIKEKQFFYRDCMKQFFDPQKFLVQGYKGTGKTYLYKALGDETISKKIRDWADPARKKNECIFINVLPVNKGEEGIPFNNISYLKIEEPEYYFNCFWQIHTWNSILLNPEFASVKESSKLKDLVLPISGMESVKRFNDMIDNGIDTLIEIERDMKSINNYLVESNKTLFVLYDRLDTCINPLRWNKAVSPLISFWRDNCESFSNICPKIFIRTDLFRQIEGTNTARLAANIINIEWSIGEVFGYFFKLIFSDEKASKAYWAIAEKVGISHDYIKNTKAAFKKAPGNQFRSLMREEMAPVIQVFFGRAVKVRDSYLGSPWEYFGKELANADNSAISLRPFINTFDHNAVDRALGRTERYVKEIISPEIYASREVRIDSTDMYFNDLAKDEFSRDLLKFKDVLMSASGEQFRYKSLTEIQFNDLINLVFSKIPDSPVVRTSDDLISLIFANGIMSEKITSIGKFYKFASIYHYAWGLANGELETEDKKRKREEKIKQSQPEEGKQYEGEVIAKGNRYFAVTPELPHKDFIIRRMPFGCIEGDQIKFYLKSEPSNKGQGLFWYAMDVEITE